MENGEILKDPKNTIKMISGSVGLKSLEKCLNDICRDFDTERYSIRALAEKYMGFHRPEMCIRDRSRVSIS